jgi:hypothetical protein
MAMELDAAGRGAAGAAPSDDTVTLVAEANGNAAAKTPATTTVELDAGNTTVHLPEGTDTSHPVQVGNDLEFIQPDGSIILIPGGAVTGLVIFVGNVEIPADAVAALFEANNIQPAEGPQGPPQNGHGNFTHEPGGIGNAFGLTDLLPPTALAFGTNPPPELFPPGLINRAPYFSGDNGNQHIHAVSLLDVSEEGLAGTGIPDGGPDAQRDTTDLASRSGTFGVVDPDGDPLTFTIGTPSELKSHGVTLEWSGVGTNLLIGSLPNGGAEIIRIEITDGAVNDGKGQYTVTLSGPIDHPDTSLEDVQPLTFNVTVSDGKGGSDTAAFSLGIEDDSPTLTVTAATGERLLALTQGLDETVGTDRYNADKGETAGNDNIPTATTERPGWRAARPASRAASLRCSRSAAPTVPTAAAAPRPAR